MGNSQDKPNGEEPSGEQPEGSERGREEGGAKKTPPKPPAPPSPRPPVGPNFRLMKPLVYDHKRRNGERPAPAESPRVRKPPARRHARLPAPEEAEEDEAGGAELPSPPPRSGPSEGGGGRLVIVPLSGGPTVPPTNRATPLDVADARRELEKRLRERRAAQSLRVTIDSVIAGFKPREVALLPNATVGMLKQKLKGRARMNRLTLSFNGKELLPDQSTLESHGVTNGARILVHVRSQTGTSNAEHVAALLDLSRSLGVLRDLLNSMPVRPPPEEDEIETGTRAGHRSAPKARTMTAEEWTKRAGENQKTREQMGKIREKMGGTTDSSTSASTGSSTSSESSASSTSGTSAGSSASSTSTGSTASSASTYSTHPHASAGRPDEPLGAQEAAAFFDPPENAEFVAERRDRELADPPESAAELERLKAEFRAARCGFCHTRLPLALRVQPCRCARLYCRQHRQPERHCCSVDWKRVDRAKLEAAVVSRPRTPANEDRDDLADTPRKGAKP